jgi:hypothetical protein
MARRAFRFFGSSAGERAAALRSVTSPRGGVLLTTYGMVLHNAEALAHGLGRIADGGARAPGRRAPFPAARAWLASPCALGRARGGLAGPRAGAEAAAVGRGPCAPAGP